LARESAISRSADVSAGRRCHGRAMTTQHAQRQGAPHRTPSGARALLGGFFADPDFDFEARIALGNAACGVGDVGLVLATVAGITDGDRPSWFAAWTARADQLGALGDEWRAAGDLPGARWAYLAASEACARALNAVDGLPPERGDAVLLPTFRRGRGYWDAMIDASAGRFVRVDVPYERSTLPGYLLRPDATGAARPTLVMTNGSDGPLSSLWASGVSDAHDRGWNVFVYDGPGQQSMLFERNVPFRPDWEAVLTPVVDALVARPDVDANALTAYAISQGGYWLPRALAFEHRIVAAVADGGGSRLPIPVASGAPATGRPSPRRRAAQRAEPRPGRSAAAAAPAAPAAGRPGRHRRAAGTDTPAEGDGVEQLDRVGVSGRARRRVARGAHGPVDLERGGTFAAAEVVARHAGHGTAR
jgi:hypothetical protein